MARGREKCNEFYQEVVVMLYDVIILGSGPAGLSAAVYAERARLDTLVIEEKPLSGGQILDTYEVDNYPGLPGISGFELGQKFREHADKLGTEFVNEQVIEIKNLGEKKQVITGKKTYEARTLILATGARHRKLMVPGEEAFTGRGVSYCATCDGAFFREKTVAVVGGGDVALEDALFLARACRKVYLIHRRDAFRGARILQERVRQTENIELKMNCKVTEIHGEEQVSSVTLHHNIEETEHELQVQGVFIAVGISPNTAALDQFMDQDEQGYIVAGEDTKTSVPGIFAAGDVRTKQLRQVITAAADGANAVTSVERYLSGFTAS
ncbi:MAG: thioredoxin-disulfide reductase [Lachnospiraceae bacterium]|nr:thioredoxin-disulfide reductase [Lachnospiraceae bacterium]